MVCNILHVVDGGRFALDTAALAKGFMMRIGTQKEVGSEKGSPNGSTLVFGEYDAVLLDAMTPVAEAEALANWVTLRELRFRETDSIPARRTK